MNSTTVYFNNWSEAFSASLQGLWIQVVNALPEILGALIILFLGLLAASLLGRIARRAARFAKVDELTRKTGITEVFSDAGMKFSFSALIGWVVKWFFIVVVLMAAANVLGWAQVTAFLSVIALYIPNVLIAILIFGIGLVVSHFAYSAILKSAGAARQLSDGQERVLANFGKWAIIIFSLLASLSQLGIATRLIEILFAGVVAALAIAFGLGGKEKAAKILSELDRS